MKILVACEYSGRVRDAFIAQGHQAISCDLLPTEIEGPHIQGNVLDVLDQGWDMMIAHPSCTYLTNSGVQWLHKDPSRWDKLDEACEFFNRLLDAPIEKICIENPIPHKYAIERLHGRKYSQLIQPYMFGHTETKATCFWLQGLEKLNPTSNLKAETMALPDGQRQRLHWLSPSPTRWKDRSRTYEGIATAMAEQWGSI
jgi:hypothetical protein